jgi:Rad3-related DNA helicase
MSILSDWDNSAPDAVLIGPSLTTGIDLSGDAARFNIIVKISYPSMGSALNAKRYETAYHVYVGEAASTLEQACGRTTRSADDWSITYILDSRAEGFISSNKTLFSPSFMDRIVKKS